MTGSITSEPQCLAAMADCIVDRSRAIAHGMPKLIGDLLEV
jgi:hypothetical protein